MMDLLNQLTMVFEGCGTSGGADMGFGGGYDKQHFVGCEVGDGSCELHGFDMEEGFRDRVQAASDENSALHCYRLGDGGGSTRDTETQTDEAWFREGAQGLQD